MSASELNFLKLENQKLREYLHLFELEIEFRQRIREIKENFSNSDDVNRFVRPLLDRLEKISYAKTSLKKELGLK